jgi:sterol desaturase/sphingolipid hydroxylase (fatty acid hydroxylase superfamily)
MSRRHQRPVNLIILAIPVFFLLIAVEVVAAHVQRKRYYALADSVADLGTGMIQQLLDVFARTALFAGYVFVYERHRVATLDDGAAWVWAACFLGVDFLYYWFHRLSHEVNAFWAAHVVHHQSEEYNLTVALRQGALQGWFGWVFYLPLALLGFPPLVFLTMNAASTLYQFWIHTRAIGKLGPLEWVLNTPSNHRVHHGRNPKYIDRNHGAALIVWDRLFGTYQAEEEEVVYGITTPLASWNPVWANLHYWVDLGGRARRASRPMDKLRLFFARPGWNPEDLGGFQPAPEVTPDAPRFHVAVPARVQAYVLAQFAVVLLGTSVFLFRLEAFPPAARVAVALAVVASLVVFGGLLERRSWAVPAEAARVIGMLAAVMAVALAG